MFRSRLLTRRSLAVKIWDQVWNMPAKQVTRVLILKLPCGAENYLRLAANQQGLKRALRTSLEDASMCLIIEELERGGHE